MTKQLPVLSGAELIRALERVGFEQVRQRGSHVTLRHEDGRHAIVPLHREIKRGTLGGILRQAVLSVDDLQRARQRDGQERER